MESHCLRNDLLPGTSRLLLDYIHHFENLSAFYTYQPYKPESLRRAAEAVRYPAERRRALVEALGVLNPSSPLLTKLSREGTVAIATGQQVGYLGGPAYSVYKALTAVRIAESLEAAGVPAVPVFWLASEDHDLAEVDHAWLFDAKRAARRYQAEKRAGNQTPPSHPVGPRPVPPVRVEELERSLAGLPFAPEAIALASEFYREGNTYSQAFRGLLERFLGRHQILFLDPLQEEIRALAAPLLADAVTRFPKLAAGAAERSAALGAAGYHAQVHLEADSSFFFLLDEGERLSLRARNGRFLNGNRSWSPQELAARAAAISPNALLRPVVQDYLLPTACLVGGAAEIAYLAQSGPLYQELLGRQPVFQPRNSFTLIDGKAARDLDRYQIAVPEFFTTKTPLEERLARTRIPAGLQTTMESAREQASALLDGMREQLLAFDPTLAAASERSKTRVLYQFQKLARKTAREIARREERIRSDARYLGGLIYPEKHLQERIYSFLSFFAAYGEGLADVVYRNIHEDCPDHHVVVI